MMHALSTICQMPLTKAYVKRERGWEREKKAKRKKKKGDMLLLG